MSRTPGERCARSDVLDLAPLVTVSVHRTFHDDFDEHPLLNGRWVPHYAGAGSLPESFYAGGEGSVLGRKTKYNGEQQIYVDPGYEGRGMVPLGLDPFKVRDGVLSIVASRIPSDLKEVLFSNEYVSGVLTTQKSFSQKYGYFEIHAKIPLGTGVWPAFCLLANDGGWPPEIDAMEGRGQRPGDVVMTTHWRIPATGFVESCGFDFSVPNAWTDFHDYGVLSPTAASSSPSLRTAASASIRSLRKKAPINGATATAANDRSAPPISSEKKAVLAAFRPTP